MTKAVAAVSEIGLLYCPWDMHAHVPCLDCRNLFVLLLTCRAIKPTYGMQDTVENLAFLVEEYGMIPNGGRSYYLDRR